MSNNYHTQMEHKPNMLNEIAAQKQLLQPQQIQQMAGFQGTPINRQQPIQQGLMPAQPGQVMTPQQIMMMQQQMQAQQQQIQHMHQQQMQQQQVQTQSHDEIELSEQKPVSSQVQQVAPAESVQQIVQLPNPASELLQSPTVDHSQVIQQLQHQLVAQGKSFQRKLDTIKQTEIKTTKETAITEYVTLPVALLAGFIILLHPKTSKYFDKYIPSIYGANNATLKNIFIKGLILVVIYLAVRFMSNMVMARK